MLVPINVLIIVKCFIVTFLGLMVAFFLRPMLFSFVNRDYIPSWVVCRRRASRGCPPGGRPRISGSMPSWRRAGYRTKNMR